MMQFVRQREIGISYGTNLYFGGELGAGFKGILNVNVGYRF